MPGTLLRRSKGSWRWALPVLVVLLFAPPGRAETEATALFPYGVREDARPDRVARTDRARGEALAHGLTWLAAHQTPAGDWEPHELSWFEGKRGEVALEGVGKSIYRTGVTGIATLAFLATGHTHQTDSPHAQVVARALEALANAQDAEGCLGPRTSMHFVYNHAFAALALVEAYGLTGDPRLLGPSRKALSFLETAQNPGSGWRYGVRPGESDTSATGCNLMPFHAADRVNHAARAAGQEAPLPFSPAVMAGARAWVLRMTDPSYARTGYLHEGGASARPQHLLDRFPFEYSEACTAIGLLLLEVTGEDGAAPTVLEGRLTQTLLRMLPRWDVAEGRTDLYYWYYGTLALRLRGGEAWETWWKATRAALLEGQRRDTDVARYRGSWDAVTPWGEDGGRIYTTAMAVLALATPERHPAFEGTRDDLVAALAEASRPAAERVRLLAAVRRYDLEDARTVVIRATEAAEAEVRAEALATLAALTPSADATTALARRLRDPDAAVRRAAAIALARHGPASATAIDVVASVLADADTGVCVAALEALGAMGPAGAKREADVRARLEAGEAAVRVAAAGALVGWDRLPEGGEAALLAGLDDASPALRRDAARHLARLARRTDAVLAALRGRLGDDDARVRVAAAHGLARIHDDPAPLVGVATEALATGDPGLWDAALELAAALGEEGRPLADAVLPLAIEGPAPRRIRALAALAAMGPATPNALAALYAGTLDATPAVRTAAEQVLAARALEEAEAAEALGAALGAEAQALRDGAVRGLVACGAAGEGAALAALARPEERAWPSALDVLAARGTAAGKEAHAAALRALRTATTPAPRAAALRALGPLGARDPAVVVAVGDALRAPDEAVRAAAVQALGHLAEGSPPARDLLFTLAAGRGGADVATRAAALCAIGLAGREARDGLDVLLDALGAEDEVVRGAAVDGLVAVGKPAVRALCDAIALPSETARKGVFEALGRMGEDAKDAVPALADFIEHGRNWEVHEAGRALVGIGKRSTTKLKRLLRSDNAYARAAAARAVGALGEDAASAERLLRGLRDDPSPTVREEAEKALRRLE